MAELGCFLSCEEHEPRSLVSTARRAEEAGFDEVYISQVGDDQLGFFDFFRRELRRRLHT